MTDKEQWKYVKRLLLILILFPPCCCDFLFLYARLAGRWASSTVLPLPPQSTLVEEHVFDSEVGGYKQHVGLYTIGGTLADVSRWFSNYIPMLPDLSGVKEGDKHYYSLQAPGNVSTEYSLLWLGGLITGHHHIDMDDPIAPNCFYVSLY